MVKFKALTGIDYPPNKRIEAGDVVDDLPAKSIKWLREQGLIESVDESTPLDAPAIMDYHLDETTQPVEEAPVGEEVPMVEEAPVEVSESVETPSVDVAVPEVAPIPDEIASPDFTSDEVTR